MPPIKVVQIGTGHDHAAQTLECMLSMPEVFSVVGVCEPNPEYKERLDTFAVYRDIPRYSYEDIFNIEGVQAAAVEADEKSAIRYAIDAAKAGLSIHLDKPGSYTLSEFEELINIVKANGISLQMGYMYRYNPKVMEALKLKNEGKLGRIFSVEAQMSVRLPKEKREWLGDFTGGMMYYLGCHLVDLVMLFMGEPDEVEPINFCTHTEDEKYCEDHSFALLKYKDGLSFVKANAAEVGGYGRRQLVVTGTDGTYEIKPLEEYNYIEKTVNPVKSYAKMALYEQGQEIYGEVKKPLPCDIFGRYDAMLKSWADITVGNAENPFTPDYELSVFKTLLKCCGR